VAEVQSVEVGGNGAGPDDAVPPAGGRVEAVERATKTWTGQLVDLTGRNNLLYYRDLKVGTLPLDSASRQLIFDALVGRSVTISKLFPEEEALADALKRARTVNNKSRAHFEERGLETLYLACGMATWSGSKSASTPAAPILLVPVRLAPRGAAQEEFELTVTGELEVNPTFLQLLKAEFDVACEPGQLLASAGIEGVIDTPEELTTAFAWLREQCRSVPGFAINERFVVGNFSYARLPMVRDLETSLEAMAEHDIVAALAGDTEAQAALRGQGASNEVPSPDFVPPGDEFLVLDADSSQNYAINAVLAGRNLIIKGPPGTGKSQTISNLISTLVARGKHVLFVAEKRAAIDAVLKRLTDVGLDDLVLDLHGGVSSRRKTAEALSSALRTNEQLAKPRVEQVHRKLEQRRGQLNTRVQALHRRRDPWGVSFFEVQSRLVGLPETASTDIQFHGDTLDGLSEDTIAQLSDDLQKYVGLGGLQLSYSGSPWAKATVVSQEEAQALELEIESLRRSVPEVLGQLGRAAAATGLTEPATIADWQERLLLWLEIVELLEVWEPGVFELDLEQLLADAEALGGSAGARVSATLISGEYRAAKKTLREAIREGHKLSANECYESATKVQQLIANWRDLATEASAAPSGPGDLAELTTAYEALCDRLAALAHKLDQGPLDGAAEETLARLDALLADVPTLSKLPELHRLHGSLTQAGMQDLLAGLEGKPVNREEAAQTLECAWLRSLVRHIQLSETVLGAFDGEQHREVVEEFMEADREHIETTPKRVRRLCAEQAVAAQDAEPDNAALIRAEAAKKRRHLAIRQLFSATPEIMTSLKPCWVMSPLVVSQVLPSDQPYFDVVVFDEASQVRPAEAMPAILRGRQLVVAGDERQLPPTSFFSGGNLETDESEEESTTLVADASYESILEALAGFVDFRMLQWHYRSRDERLITFSNVHLYDRGLTTFPGVVAPDCIRHVHVPFTPGKLGSETSASPEVERVVELIIDHAEQHPSHSLGVIAMGIKHADRIDEALRAALHEREDLDEFFDVTRHEPFFIKNLERVQGDERDAIILSVGYGKNSDGRLLYRFGPINQEGGERRLNVAVTRAKERMTLVSSFTHLDMDPERSQARGVQLLRAYLEYCASNGSKLSETASQIPELNPFEVDVRDTLVRAGIPLVAQYGASGYRIDFAAKHPTQPGRMVLAIETDGATYHSSQSARDRDRLRQEHLERLGWTFHRIWSQDWFNEKPQEIERAKAAYAAAVVAADRPEEPDEPEGLDGTDEGPSGGPGPNTPIAPLLAPEGAPRDGSCPVNRSRGSIDQYTSGQLRRLITWIESDTLLRTREQLLEEAMQQLGFRRRGSKIVAALTSAIDASRASAGRA
jgi:very-short-patch-repair endonuclease